MSQQTGALLGFVHRRRRGAELFLLLLALAVSVGAYAAVDRAGRFSQYTRSGVRPSSARCGLS